MTSFMLKQKRVHMNGLDFCQCPKNFIFWPFQDFLGPLDPPGHFFKNHAPHDEPLLRLCVANGQMNKWTNERTERWMGKQS